MGQHRYYERHWKQLEQLFCDIDYHTLQIIRKSRTVRRYHWDTRKNAIAQDEMMELINRWYSLYPMPRTMEGFKRESVQVGLSLVCKLFIEMVCKLTTTSHLEPPRAASQRFNQETVTFMIEYLTTLRTGVNMTGRVFSRTFITSKRSKVKSSLTVQKLEDRITAEENEPTYDLCHSLRQAMAPGQNSIVQNSDVLDGESNQDGDVESREHALEELRRLNEDDSNRIIRPNDVDDDMVEFETRMSDPEEFDGPDMNNESSSNGRRSNTDFATQARQMIGEINVIGFNKLALFDLWSKGARLVEKDNLKVTREGTKRRMKRKMAFSMAIHKKVAEMNAATESVIVEESEVECTDTIWRRHARSNSIFHK